MKNLNKNEKGFSAVEFVLLLVVLVLLGTVGWYVYKQHHKTTSAVVITKQVTTPTNIKQTVTTENYTDTAAGTSFSYPSTWTLTHIKGLCDVQGGCSDASAKINAVQLTSSDKQVEIIWSGIGGIGGDCNPAPLSSNPATSGSCSEQTVFSVTPIPKATGLYVVEGAQENYTAIGKYTPFLAVQDSKGVLKTGSLGTLWYQTYTSPVTTFPTLFNMNNGYKDAGGGTIPKPLSSLASAQTYFNTADLTQAKNILLSMSVQ